MEHYALSKVPTNVIQSKERLLEVQWDPALHSDRPSTPNRLNIFVTGTKLFYWV
jgi:hypothetical protein